MGMYTGLRFKGYVKPQFRESFEEIAIKGEWEESKDKKFKEFSKLPRASSIPCGTLSLYAIEWEEDETFDRKYDKKTGYWCFQCSLKNYYDEIDNFINIIPYFIESAIHIEELYEESEESTFYTLKDGKIIEIKKQKNILK